MLKSIKPTTNMLSIAADYDCYNAYHYLLDKI
jgi:hypothetical protein